MVVFKIVNAQEYLSAVAFLSTEVSTLVEAKADYAYGNLIITYTSGTPNERYKFTGKESVYVRQSGTSPDRRDKQIMIIFPNGMAMPGARYGVYPAESGNSELGRWMQVDPLASKYPGCLPAEVPFYGTKEGSPYNHTLGNPVNLIDPDGMEVLEGGGEDEDDEEENDWVTKVNNYFSSLFSLAGNSTVQYDNNNENPGSTIKIDLETIKKITKSIKLKKEEDYNNSLTPEQQKAYDKMKATNMSLDAVLERIFKSKRHETVKGPYTGPYKGLGLGGPDIVVPHSGSLYLMDYINWLRNKPNEVQKMATQWRIFLEKVKE